MTIRMTLGEQLAIDSFKNGATDCIPKGDLSRLAPAVRRAMWEVEERVERRLLEAQIIEAQKMEVISQLSSGAALELGASFVSSPAYKHAMILFRRSNGAA